MRAISFLLVFFLFFFSSAQASTREDVVKRDRLRCGVSTEAPGFSSLDTKGRWSGFDVDFCRAVAVAVLGDRSKVEFVPLGEGEAFTTLLSGEVDLLARQALWTLSRDTALAVHFIGVSYYDSLGIMVEKDSGVSSLEDLEKRAICVAANSREAEFLEDYSEQYQLDLKFVPYESHDLAVKGFGRNCSALSLKKSSLYGLLAEGQVASEILADFLAKEPLGPVVRQGDDVWFNIVRWTLFALVNAEELGIFSQNIAEMKISNRSIVQKFLGLEEDMGVGIGLQRNWAAEVIRQVGNYGEIFERNLGSGSSLGIDRGLNRLWNRGGLQFAPPFE